MGLQIIDRGFYCSRHVVDTRLFARADNRAPVLHPPFVGAVVMLLLVSGIAFDRLLVEADPENGPCFP